MKKISGLAVPALLSLAVFFISPLKVRAFSVSEFTPAFRIIAASDNTTSSAGSIFDMFPMYIWIIFAVVILIIIGLSIFLLISPKKEKGQATARQKPPAKVPRQGERISRVQPSEDYMPSEGMPPEYEAEQNVPPVPQQPYEVRRPAGPSARPGANLRQPSAAPRPRPTPMASQPGSYAAEYEPQVQPQPPLRQPRPAPQYAAGPQTPPSRVQPVPPQPGQPPVQRPFARPPMGTETTSIFGAPQVSPGAVNRPIFHVTNLNIIPTEVKEDDPVTISVTVFNAGKVTGKYNVVFRINHIVESIAELTLGPGASQTTVCTVQKDTEGEYFVDVEGLRGMFTVLKRAPAAFEVSDLSIKPERVKQGQPVSISFHVTNTGERPGTYTATLFIKGMAEASEDVQLEPGETKVVTFNIIKDVAGFYPVTVEDLSGRFVVEMDWRE